uniref:Rhodopsin domain-containing protein n=1 Tax=Bionectria ochroleuca TaxID=29856 RepID=A0A8H7K8Y6_BIOOC
MSNIPAGIPRPDTPPNFVNPESLGNMPKIFTYVTLPPMLILFTMRIFTRIKTSRTGIDDYLCALSAASIGVYIILTFIVVDEVAGPHMYDIPVSKLTTSYAENTVTQGAFYFIASMFIKTAILALYLRIFSPSPVAKQLLWIGIAVTAVFYLTSMSVFLGHCVPRPADFASGGYLSLQTSARCFKVSGPVSLASGIVGTIIDFYVLVLPVVFLWSLRTSFKKKAGIAGVFLAGIVACVLSIIGTVYRMKIFVSKNLMEQDLTWNSMPIYATCIAEINIGIACSCIPIVFVHFKSLGSLSGSWFSKIRYMSGRKGSSGRGDPRTSRSSTLTRLRWALPAFPRSPREP